VRQPTVQQHQGAFRRLQRHQPVDRQGRRVERHHPGPGAVADELPVQRPAMAAGLCPHAAVLDRGVLEREPEADAALGCRVQEAAVLVAMHLAADARLLEDVHRLDQQRPRQADRPGDPGEPRIAREPVEHRVEIVQGVADLVQRQLLGLAQPPLGVEGVGLEEEADLVAGFEEVAVAAVALVVGAENRGDARRVEGIDQLGHPPAQRRAGGSGGEAVDDEEALAFPVRQLFRGQFHRPFPRALPTHASAPPPLGAAATPPGGHAMFTL